MKTYTACCLVAAALVVAATTIHPTAIFSPFLLLPRALLATDELPVHSSRAEEEHRVRKLPGWGRVGFRMYAGGVPVSKDKELFYVLVEAQHRPRKAPVVLWLTGGPGCSSVGTAWIGEHGPFFPKPGSTSKLQANKYSYHQLAHMVYLDAPAYVGFSYSNSSDDREVGDRGMARDVMEFILQWRKLYPDLAGNPFWLAGESYAGHYIPFTAWEVLKYNNESSAGSRGSADSIDFRGFMLGNPSTDPYMDNEGRLTYWWSHGLISEDVKKEIEDHCDFGEVIITPDIEVKTRKESKACRKAVEDAISEIGPIDIQDVTGDKCKRKFDAHVDSAELDPCISQEGEKYLSRRDVQDALHANMSGQLDWKYQGCTEGHIFKYSVDDQVTSVLPLHRDIMDAAPKLRILVYTGDADGMVPLTGTRRWVFKLGTEEGKKKRTHWRYWKDLRGQVGGYLEEYQDFTFLTIRKAGHEAPYTAKERTFYVYKTWLAEKDIV